MYDSELMDLIWSRLSKGRADACWLWRGQVAGRVPCPVINWRRKRYTVLRPMWWWLTGEEIEGRMALVRMCGNSLCVNPNHFGKSEPGSLAAQIRSQGKKYAAELSEVLPRQNIFYVAGMAGYDLRLLDNGRYKVVEAGG